MQCFFRFRIFTGVHRYNEGVVIFLDRFYNLKIGGFDYAEFVGEEQNNSFFGDIFDVGLVIIQLLTGKLELKIIRKKVKTAIKKGNFNSFWRIIENQGEFDFSPELKDLVNQMLSGKITDIRKLLSHDWFDKVHNMCPNEFKLLEQFMKNELRKYEGNENGEIQS